MSSFIPSPGLSLALLALLPVSALAAPLEGRWEADGLGLIEITRDGTRYVARQVSGAACSLPTDRPVLEGELEGTLLVGSLWLCQRGPSCAAKAFPVVAVHDSDAGRLSALVRLESGCTSPAVPGAGVSLVRVGDLPTPTGEAVSAANVAERAGLSSAEKQRLLASLLERGHALLQSGRSSESIAVWQEMLSIDSKSWLAHLGMGLAQMNLDRLPQAQREMELALRHAPAGSWDVHFNLACLHARRGNKQRSLHHLEEAVKRGFDMPESMARDTDLAGLLRNDLAFQRLVQRAGVNRDRARRR